MQIELYILSLGSGQPNNPINYFKRYKNTIQENKYSTKAKVILMIKLRTKLVKPVKKSNCIYLLYIFYCIYLLYIYPSE